MAMSSCRIPNRDPSASLFKIEKYISTAETGGAASHWSGDSSLTTTSKAAPSDGKMYDAKDGKESLTMDYGKTKFVVVVYYKFWLVLFGVGNGVGSVDGSGVGSIVGSGDGRGRRQCRQ